LPLFTLKWAFFAQDLAKVESKITNEKEVIFEEFFENIFLL